MIKFTRDFAVLTNLQNLRLVSTRKINDDKTNEILDTNFLEKVTKPSKNAKTMMTSLHFEAHKTEKPFM